MGWRVFLNDEDITDEFNAALRREAALNDVAFGSADADIRAGHEQNPDEPDGADLN